MRSQVENTMVQWVQLGCTFNLACEAGFHAVTKGSQDQHTGELVSVHHIAHTTPGHARSTARCTAARTALIWIRTNRNLQNSVSDCLIGRQDPGAGRCGGDVAGLGQHTCRTCTTRDHHTVTHTHVCTSGYASSLYSYYTLTVICEWSVLVISIRTNTHAHTRTRGPAVGLENHTQTTPNNDPTSRCGPTATPTGLPLDLPSRFDSRIKLKAVSAHRAVPADTAHTHKCCRKPI